MWPAERLAARNVARPEFGMCCKRENVGRLVPMPEGPPPLAALLTDTTPCGWGFRQHIRMYNCSLQVASSAIRVTQITVFCPHVIKAKTLTGSATNVGTKAHIIFAQTKNRACNIINVTCNDWS